MARDGKPTRDKILAESKALIYENGFAGTSIDLILERTGITKGAFFYHFKTKADLALTLIHEFAAADMLEMQRALDAAHAKSSDPRKQLFHFMKHFIDLFAELREPPGCLYASVSNEQNQYDDEIKRVVEETILRWRNAISEMIRAVAKQYPPKSKVDVEALADQLTVVTEGAFIVSRALHDPSVTTRQLKLTKHYLELLFGK